MTQNLIKEYLDSLPKNETIYYRANPGNAGDALIASGAFKLFDECKLDIKLVDPANFDASNKIIIYAGGGNLVGIYPEARDFFAKHHKKAKQLILLPHTIAKNEDLLRDFGKNVTLFARELISHEHIKQHAPNANLFIDHDLALQLNAKDIISSQAIHLPEALLLKLVYKLTKSEKTTHIPSIKKMLENTLFEINTQKQPSANFFRDDVERLSDKLPEKNADLSKIYEYGTKNEDLTKYTTRRLMRYINRFSVIRTDRLHICIAAALLNKEVDFFANSYFKCRAVYEYSLQEKFPNIKWMGDTP